MPSEACARSRQSLKSRPRLPPSYTRGLVPDSSLPSRRPADHTCVPWGRPPPTSARSRQSSEVRVSAGTRFRRGTREDVLGVDAVSSDETLERRIPEGRPLPPPVPVGARGGIGASSGVKAGAGALGLGSCAPRSSRTRRGARSVTFIHRRLSRDSGLRPARASLAGHAHGLAAAGASALTHRRVLRAGARGPPGGAGLQMVAEPLHLVGTCLSCGHGHGHRAGASGPAAVWPPLPAVPAASSSRALPGPEVLSEPLCVANATETLSGF